jgi:hypothetical protein
MRFENKPGGKYVSRGDYAIASHEDGAIISESTWGEALRHGMAIDMNIILREQRGFTTERHICPACSTYNPTGASKQNSGVTW